MKAASKWLTWLISEQDSDNYDAKQQNASAGGSFTLGSMSGSGSVNLSRDKMHSNYDSVQEQTGIFAGQGGVDITVGEHTQLNGAVIGSTASAEKNTLDTGTLGFSDIENKADYQVEHQSVGISSGGSIGGQFAGNMANGLLTGVNDSGSARSTTQSAVSEGTIIIRDPANQQQDVADLSRDVEHANQTLSPIFDKEKEQNRLREAQLIGEIGNQVSDIVRTQGQIEATKAANERMQSVTPEQLKSAEAEWRKTNPGKEPTADDISGQVYQNFYNQAFNASGYGTGGKYQQVIQAATAAVQGLAGGDLAKALPGGSAPYLATIIAQTTEEGTSRLMAHAVVNAVLAAAQGNNVLAGAAGAVSGEVMAQLVMEALYPGKNVSELSESEKQTISMLGTLAAGLAGGLIGDSNADTLTAAQAGKTTVENNFLSSTSSAKRDELAEKVKKGDKTLQTAKEFLELENADQRSDALVALFNSDPAAMTAGEKVELASYLRIYAAEMQAQYGDAVTKELITGMLTGQDYLKSAPQTEAQQQAQTIMKTWGYHKSNAGIGDPALIFGSSMLGNTIKEGMALNAAIGTAVNTGVQLSGNDEFSYVDAILAGVTAAATTGKGWKVSAAINMGGAAVGSGIKGEDPTNSVAGAGAGTVAGGIGGTIIKGVTSKVAEEAVSDLTGAIGGSYISEETGNFVKSHLDEKGKNENKN